MLNILFCVLQELKRHALVFAKPLFTSVINSEGFAALNKRLTTQLVRELVGKRRLMDSSSSSEGEEVQTETQSKKCRLGPSSWLSRTTSQHSETSSSDSDSSSSESDCE